jgi:hypothetical protein
MKKLNGGQWTPKQLERLPDAGYWLETYEFDKPYLGEKIHYTGYCIMNGRIQYVRSDEHGTGWHTLLWSCMPTRRQIETGRDPRAKFYHFATLEEMLAEYPDLPARFHERPDNDF